MNETCISGDRKDSQAKKNGRQLAGIVGSDQRLAVVEAQFVVPGPEGQQGGQGLLLVDAAEGMPEHGLEWLSRTALLRFEEMLRLCRVLVGLGIEKIRITGGEPFVRKDLMKFFHRTTLKILN